MTEITLEKFNELQKKYDDLLAKVDGLKKERDYHKFPVKYKIGDPIYDAQCYKCHRKILYTRGCYEDNFINCETCRNSLCQDCEPTYECKFEHKNWGRPITNCFDCITHGCIGCNSNCCTTCSEKGRHIDMVEKCGVCNLGYCIECPVRYEKNPCSFCEDKILICRCERPSKQCTRCKKSIFSCIKEECQNDMCESCVLIIKNLLEEITIVPPIFKSHPGGIEYQNTQEEFKEIQLKQLGKV